MGWIYLAKNEHMPAVVKIGFTTRTAEEQVQELSSSSGVPGSFWLAGSWQIEHADHVEEILLSELGRYRVEDRGFFLLDVQKARSAIELLLINNTELKSLYQANIDRIRAAKEAQKVNQETEIYKREIEEPAIDDWKFNRSEIIRKCTVDSAKLFSKQELINELKLQHKALKKEGYKSVAFGLTLFATYGWALPVLMALSGGEEKPKTRTILDELNKEFRVRYLKARDELFKWHEIEVPEKIVKYDLADYSMYDLGDYCGLSKDFIEYIKSGGYYGR